MANKDWVEPHETYWVCYGESCFELRLDVNRFMDNGWKPIGGVAILQDASARMQFFQAMVKER